MSDRNIKDNSTYDEKEDITVDVITNATYGPSDAATLLGKSPQQLLNDVIEWEKYMTSKIERTSTNKRSTRIYSSDNIQELKEMYQIKENHNFSRTEASNYFKKYGTHEKDPAELLEHSISVATNALADKINSSLDYSFSSTNAKLDELLSTMKKLAQAQETSKLIESQQESENERLKQELIEKQKIIDELEEKLAKKPTLLDVFRGTRK